MNAAMSYNLHFRRITEEDREFLYRVYSSTRQEELALVPWSEGEKAAFLEMQFKAQHQYYQERFQKAEFQIVLQDDKPIGRLYLDRREDMLHLIDIALLPE
ncbi:MAG: GNAT family N-acetyltransferase, partial [Dehalococcoidia bacterium]